MRRNRALVMSRTSTFLTVASGTTLRRASSTAWAARMCPAPTDADRTRMRGGRLMSSFSTEGAGAIRLEDQAANRAGCHGENRRAGTVAAVVWTRGEAHLPVRRGAARAVATTA